MNDKCANPKCGKELIHVEGRKKKKYCDRMCKLVHWQAMNPKPRVRIKKHLVELPADFINCEKVGIIKADGTIEELKDFEQLPTLAPFLLPA